MLNKISNFTYTKTLDLIMGYYNVSLTDVAKKLFTITTPFGKCKYTGPTGCNRGNLGLHLRRTDRKSVDV